MLKIRLRRMGATKQPSYRLVVADSRAPRNGAFLETLGHYNPRTDPITLQVDEEKVLQWLRQGAQPTDVVRELLTRTGTMAKFTQKEG